MKVVRYVGLLNLLVLALVSLLFPPALVVTLIAAVLFCFLIWNPLKSAEQLAAEGNHDAAKSKLVIPLVVSALTGQWLNIHPDSNWLSDLLTFCSKFFSRTVPGPAELLSPC